MGQCKILQKMFLTKLLSFTLVSLVVFNMVETREVSRVTRQSELPPNFQCNLCDKCNQPCSSSCGKCSGCDLAALLNLPIPECTQLCKGGVSGCTATCEQNQEGCKFCKYCE